MLYKSVRTVDEKNQTFQWANFLFEFLLLFDQQPMDSGVAYWKTQVRIYISLLLQVKNVEKDDIILKSLYTLALVAASWWTSQ